MIHPPTILVVNDEPSVLEAIDFILRQWLSAATLVSLQNSQTAWLVLSRLNPDLLIIDDRMPGISGQEICRRLLTKGFRYPIIVHSAWEPTEQWVRDYGSQGLSVRFLPCPFQINEFQHAVLKSLDTPYWRSQ